MSISYNNWIRPLLFRLSPEAAHHAVLSGLQIAGKLKSPRPPQIAPKKVMGLSFPNPIGVAAGLDKNGECINGLGTLGFGFIEIGTITPRPQPGNPKPRLFRIPAQQALINRMGFNNKGVDYLCEQVKQHGYSGILGINIGKNFDTPVEKALDDYLIGLEKVYPLADYITVNISSPNTPNLRDLQETDALKKLLEGLKQRQQSLTQAQQRYVPLALKIAPDLSDNALEQLINNLLDFEIDAVIASNTTLDKSSVAQHPHGQEQGGLSGAPLYARSNQMLKQIKAQAGDKLAIIGVGGISSPEQVQEKLNAGADLIQIYTGLVYQGPELIENSLALLKRTA